MGSQADIKIPAWGNMVRVLPGSSVSKEPFDMPVERFLSMLRFENKGKLDELGYEIDIISLETGD